MMGPYRGHIKNETIKSRATLKHLIQIYESSRWAIFNYGRGVFVGRCDSVGDGFWVGGIGLGSSVGFLVGLAVTVGTGINV